MSEEPATSKSNSGANIYIKLIFVALVLAGATLPFHYIPDRLIVFPKEQMTFSHTFITQKDIDYIIDRYNNADNIFEQQSIASEPLIRKLTERGIIRDVNDIEEDYSENEDETFSDIDAKIDEAKASIDELIEEETLSFDDFDPSVKSAFNDWEQYLMNNSIFDYVTAYDCDQYEEMMELYSNQGKYPMHADRVTIIPCELNDDGKNDYLISYTLTNCVQGNGWSRDFVFLTSSADPSSYTIDLALPNHIKGRFLEFSKEIAPNDPYVRLRDNYIEAKGLSINRIEDGVLSGSLALEADGASCCPKIKGTFTYDLKTKAFKTSINN
jgi:hypothetical protein